jgi:signal transduction histidine kinase
VLSEQQPIRRESSHFVSAGSLRVRLDWFNKMRWGAAAGILAGILIAGVWLGHPLPMAPLLLTCGVLVVLNLLYVARNSRLEAVDIALELRLVKLQMLGDLVVLTVLLNLTGGIENPFHYLFVVHVIIASLLFKGAEIYQIAWLAILLFTAEVLGEYSSVLPHRHLLQNAEMAHELHYVVATLAAFWLVLLFSAYMGASIMKHNRAIKDELVVRQSQLVAADQAKTDFFRYVTHEVKSPLTTAQSAVETALDLGGEQMEPKVQDILHRGVRRLEQATEMINNLADLTRGANLKSENLLVVDVGNLVRRVAEGLGDLAERHHIVLDLRLPHRSVVMTTSESMLEKILTNLVSNAVRYSRENGRVSVVVADEGDSVRFEVVDEGIGIDLADQARIFDEFYRTEAARSMTNLGTGLGLSIVRKFVDRLGGTITLESKPDQGSRFTVLLPRSVKSDSQVQARTEGT